MHELACVKIRLGGIGGNVSAQIFKLFGTADQMIKTVRLPKVPLAVQTSIDLHGSVVLPRFTLREHLLRVAKRRKHVNMIGHHHEVRQLISLAIKMLYAACDNLRQFRLAKHTLTVAVVQFLVPTQRKCLTVFALKA